jgi:hypothetical protein
MGDSITRYNHILNEELYLKLNNLYCVSIIQTNKGIKNVIGGFFLKTDKNSSDSDFIELLIDTLHEIDLFAKLSIENLSFKPAKIVIDERKHPLSEDDYLRIIVEQRMKIY